MLQLKIFTFFTIFYISNADMFSSVEHLRYLHEKDISVIKGYKVLLKKLNEYYTKTEKKLKSMQEENRIFSKDIDDYIMNPLNSFLLIKRLSYDFEYTVNSLKQIINDFHDNLQNDILPMSDFEGAVNGFLRLQKTYDLKSIDLANGVIEDEKFRKPLTVDDLYALGKYMVKYDTQFGQEYLSLAVNINKNSREMETFELLEELLKSYRESRKFDKAISTVDEMLKLKSDNEALEELKTELEIAALLEEDNIKDKLDEDISGSHYTAKKDSILISETCMGLRQQNATAKSKLYCFMQSKTNFTKIAPFKVEVLNIDPYVVVFYDVVSDEEIKTLQKISAIRLSRAEVLNTNSSTMVSDIRVAKLSWFYEGSHRVIDALNIRVKDMSGLSVETAEMWQIQNYGIGGHYAPHFDFFNNVEDFKTNTGNRIATTLFYLSDVKKGGATIFPFLRLKVSPKKGAAVFWYNLSSSGNKEYLTLHAACPVLIGSKWVANKWIHEYGQEFTRPCELTEKPTDDDYKQKYYVI